MLFLKVPKTRAIKDAIALIAHNTSGTNVRLHKCLGLLAFEGSNPAMLNAARSWIHLRWDD